MLLTERAMYISICVEAQTVEMISTGEGDKGKGHRDMILG